MVRNSTVYISCFCAGVTTAAAICSLAVIVFSSDFFQEYIQQKKLKSTNESQELLYTPRDLENDLNKEELTSSIQNNGKIKSRWFFDE